MTWTSCVCWVERSKRKEFEVYFSSKICIFLIRNQGFLRMLSCAGAVLSRAAVATIYWELASLGSSAELFRLLTFLIFAASMWGKSEMKVLVAQLCPTLCDPMDCSPPGSSVHGILQVRILQWVAMPFSRGFSWLRDWLNLSLLSLLHWKAGSLPLAPPGKPHWSEYFEILT